MPIAYMLIDKKSMPNAEYDHLSIEPKWQQFWEDKKLFKADDTSDEPKYYVLDMFPYPSGSGLHVGHPEGYTATDIISRYMRMKGYNVLHPMGWDAFGLPAENYAIKTKVHPKETTEKSIGIFRNQIKSLGFSYDWDREVGTCFPDYYKWTQWFFLFLYKNDLAYKKKASVNWCESCKTTLANEQVIQGDCERCKNAVIQKDLDQWFFKITKYVEDLIADLEKIDWPESTKTSQKNWIGKSIGAEVDFKVDGVDETMRVFTTRPDTLYGATYMVLAPEHPLIEKIQTSEQKEAITEYQKQTASKNEMERTELNKEKTGVFTGGYAINPLNGKKIPIWISDYVMMSYGTGAIMAVPGHDERDFEFASKFEIEIIQVVAKEKGKEEKLEEAFSGDGYAINSDNFDGMQTSDVKEKIIEKLEKEGLGEKAINYKLRDWSVSRQRYWGAPIPIIHCQKCGEVPVPEEELPVELPDDVDFMPTGESPLKYSKTFHDVKCPKCGDKAERENDTLDTFVCSSWYFFRYCDPKNKTAFASKELMQKWLPVDLYVGGAEHTVMHLLYSRFLTKALKEFGYIDFDEPFSKLRHQGIILGEDNEKMSKSRGNVINPDEIVEKYGADTLRVYEMFMGAFEQSKPWSMKGIEGTYRFLQRAWRLFTEKEIVSSDPGDEIIKLTHKTIKKVTEDIEEFGFNTAISQLMILTNALTKEEKISEQTRDIFLTILSPFTPHMCEELWEIAGHKESITLQTWPDYDESLTIDDEVEIVIQINGKVRDKFSASPDISQEDAFAKAKDLPKVQGYLAEGELVKEIYVPGKIVNLVVK